MAALFRKTSWVGEWRLDAGVSQDNLRAKTSTFEVPTDQHTTKIPREEP